MTGKQVILDMLDKKKTDRVPWVPFAGIHAGALLGYNAREVLTDSKKLLDSLLEVNKIYQADGQPVLFDLQLEAEILGCELVWEDFSPPTVKTHPLAETKTIPCTCTLPGKEDGRLPLVLDVMKQCKDKIGEHTALFGLICGPFTLASHLRSVNIFMDMYDDEDYVKALIDFCKKAVMVMTDYYVEAGMDIIACVDPLVSQISQDHFQQFLKEPYEQIFSYVAQKKARSAFFVCGNATNNLDVICQTGPHAMFVDENVDMVYAQEVTKKYGTVIGGNIPLTSIMLHGSNLDNIKFTIDMLDSLEKENLIVAPGCDMPYHTPVENTVAVSQAVHQTETMRQTVQNYEYKEEEIDVTLPDYDQLQKPLIEVFTLDSATCAACTYMMGAANEVKKEYGERVDVIEYKITEKENIARVKKMGISKLPSLYINGELKYSSIIPRKSELIELIEKL